MFTISVYIDYYYQIQRCRVQKYNEFYKEFQKIITEFGIVSEYQKEHPLYFSYTDAGPFAHFQLCCLLEAIDHCFAAYRKLFTTITLFIDSSTTPELEHDRNWDRARYILEQSPRFIVAPSLVPQLKEYVTIEHGGIIPSPISLKVKKHAAMQYANAIIPFCLPDEHLETVFTELECSTTPVLVLKLTSLLQNPEQVYACVSEAKGRKSIALLTADKYSIQATTPMDSVLPQGDETNENAYLQKLKASYNNIAMLFAGIDMSRTMLFISRLPSWIESSCEQAIRLIFEKRVTDALNALKTPWLIGNICRSISDFGTDILAAWIADAEIQHLGKILIITTQELPKGIPFENARIITASVNSDSMNAIIEKAIAEITGIERSILKNWFITLLTLNHKGHISKKRIEQLQTIVPKELFAFLYILVRCTDFSNNTARNYIITTLFGIKHYVQEIFFNTLQSFSFIFNEILLPPAFALKFEELLSENIKTYIDTIFQNLILKKVSDGSLHPSIDLLQFTGTDVSEEFIIQCLMSLAQRPDYELPAITEKLPESFKIIAKFYSAMSHGDAVQAQNNLIAIKSKPAAVLGAIISLMETEYAFATANKTEGYAHARKALLAIREQTSLKLKSRIHRMMGLLCLVSDKVTEGSEFLNNAGSFAASCRDILEECLIQYKKAIEEYLFYSLSKSLYYAKECQAYAEKICRPDYIIAAKSLMGRINFDLGLYDDSSQLFLQASILASQYNLEDARVRSALWHARALAYCGRIPEAKSILDQWNDDTEALYFLAEAELIRENYSSALEALPADISVVPKSFSAVDTIAWNSSFQEIEGTAYDFEIAGGPLHSYCNFFKTYLWLMQAFQKNSKDTLTEAEVQKNIGKLQELVKQNRALGEGPYAPQFLYWIYEIAELFPFTTIDRQTALSRAFKVFQNRSGKIDDRTARNLYMNKNRWNQKILEAAQRYHFI